MQTQTVREKRKSNSNRKDKGTKQIQLLQKKNEKGPQKSYRTTRAAEDRTRWKETVVNSSVVPPTT